jgi:hypothetical protein
MNDDEKWTILRVVRLVATVLTVAGICEGLIQASVQGLTGRAGWDSIFSIISSSWLWHGFWFCAGVATALWAAMLFAAGTDTKGLSGGAAPPAKSLHPVGMDVVIDPRKKSVQVGFNLENSSDIPLRYHVENIAVVIEGKTAMTPVFENRGGVIRKGRKQSFHFAPIPFIVLEPVNAKASIVYRYGPVGQSPVREATYRVTLVVAKSGECPCTIVEENDAEI